MDILLDGSELNVSDFVLQDLVEYDSFFEWYIPDYMDVLEVLGLNHFRKHCDVRADMYMTLENRKIRLSVYIIAEKLYDVFSVALSDFQNEILISKAESYLKAEF